MFMGISPYALFAETPRTRILFGRDARNGLSLQVTIKFIG
jgi:hypothetical protein